MVFKLPRKASVKTLQFCDSKLIALDSKNDLTVFNLQEPGAPGKGYSPPGTVTARGDGKGGVLVYFKGDVLFCDSKGKDVKIRRDQSWDVLLDMAL